jgi:hypothetical protein
MLISWPSIVCIRLVPSYTYKVLSRGLCPRGQVRGRPPFYQASLAQRCPFGHYLAKIFTTERGFIALEMAQGGVGRVVKRSLA